MSAKNESLPSLFGDLALSAYQGTPTPYSIEDGKVVTTFGGKAIELTVYKLGDNYHVARSNEYGYANYELLSKAPVNFTDFRKGDPMKRGGRQAPVGGLTE